MKNLMEHLSILMVGIIVLAVVGGIGYLISLISMKVLGIVFLIIVGLIIAYAIGIIVIDSIP